MNGTKKDTIKKTSMDFPIDAFSNILFKYFSELFFIITPYYSI